MRLAVYGAASTAIAVGVVLSAFNQRANFYSACVYLAQSNACLMVLTNILILLSIVFGHGLQLLFYGPLRAMEVEQIYEKAWYAVTETCLAMTIFRDEFDVRFIIMFGVLLFVKCFSWIGSGRVEFMEQQPPDRPLLFHARLASSLVILCVACGGMVWHAITAVLEKGKPNMMVMFAFEFAILLITSTGILSRYILSLVEKYILYKEAARRKAARAIERAAASQRRQAQREENERRRAAGEEAEEVEEVDDDDDDDNDEELDVGGWEEKGTWVFYSELCTDFLKLLTYLSFFSIVLTWYGLPLHIIRDVYLTLRSFITRIRDFIRYRRATAHMNSRYPDATAEEVGVEGVCIICREEMRPWSEEAAPGDGGRAAGTQDQRHRPKKLPCGHILHFACLRSWLERQQRCPTCRRPVLEENLAANGNANARNPGAAGNGILPQGNGVAFQAQWGFGGLQFGMGAGAMGDLIGGIGMGPQDPINQQPQVQQLQGQPGAQPQQPPGPQEQPQAPAIDQAQQSAITNALEQRILLNQRLIEREHAIMREVNQRQLQQLRQQLRARQDAAGQASTSSAPLSPPADLATPTAGSTATGQAIPPTSPLLTPNPQLTPSFTPRPFGDVGFFSPPLNPSLPHGMVLPPGWSAIPLTVLGMAGSDASAAQRPPRAANVLASRRGTRTYQESMHSYHASRTPTAEHPHEGVELGGSSSSSQPSVAWESSAPASSPPRGSTIRPTPGHRPPAPGLERESIAAISAYLAHCYGQGRAEYVGTALLGLPETMRVEILNTWEDPQQAQEIRGDIAEMLQSPNVISSAHGVAVRALATLISELPRVQRLRVLCGLPTGLCDSVIDHIDDLATIRTNTGRLRETFEDPGQLIPELPEEVPQLAEGAGEDDVARVDGETRDAVAARIVALNEAARKMREAARGLEETARHSVFSVPTLRSFSESGERLGLFGERSLFPLQAQEGALKSLQEDLVEKEREFKAKAVVEGLLGGGGATVEEEEGEEEAVMVESPPPPSPPGAVDKGKGVDRGEQ